MLHVRKGEVAVALHCTRRGTTSGLVYMQVDSAGHVCGMHQEGPKGLDPATLMTLTEIAQVVGRRTLKGLLNHMSSAAAQVKV